MSLEPETCPECGERNRCVCPPSQREQDVETLRTMYLRYPPSSLERKAIVLALEVLNQGLC